MSTNGVMKQLHNLDNFLILGSPHHNDCAASLQSVLEVCRGSGVPVATHETEGLSTKLTSASKLTLTLCKIAWPWRDLIVSLP